MAVMVVWGAAELRPQSWHAPLPPPLLAMPLLWLRPGCQPPLSSHPCHAAIRRHPPLQELAGAILSARDASELISVTHPAAARQMQRVAAHMVGALQLIAAQGGGACADPLRE